MAVNFGRIDLDYGVANTVLGQGRVHGSGITERANLARFIPYQTNALTQHSMMALQGILGRRRNALGVDANGQAVPENAAEIHLLIQAVVAGGARRTIGYLNAPATFGINALWGTVRRTINQNRRQVMDRINNGAPNGSENELQTITNVAVYAVWGDANGGGCDSRVHRRVFASESGEAKIFAISLKSAAGNNNCGIACLLDAHQAFAHVKLAQRGMADNAAVPYAKPYKSVGALRKVLVQHNLCALKSQLTPDVLKIACDWLHMNLRVYSGSFDEDVPSKIFESGGDFDVTAELVLSDGHYFRVTTECELGSCPQCHNACSGVHLCRQHCPDCGLLLQDDHECRSKRQRRDLPEPAEDAPLRMARPTVVLPNAADSGEELSPEAVKALLRDVADSADKHVLIHGAGGTGKSMFINYFKKYCDDQRLSCAVTSTTGISAVGIEGQTIFSLFKISPKTMKVSRARSADVAQLVQDLKFLIIDEISMLSADLLVALNKLFQRFRKNTSLFGGVRMVLVGDMLQLPPVNSRPLFDAPLWFDFEMELLRIPLTKLYRFTDAVWASVLGKIRLGICDGEVTDLLHTRLFPKTQVARKVKDGEILTSLYPVNKSVDKANARALGCLQGECYKMLPHASPPGNFLAPGVKKKYPMLCVKIGSAVMLTSNHLLETRGLANGSQGTVDNVSDPAGDSAERTVYVKFVSCPEDLVAVKYMTITQEDRSSARVMPLKTCHAISIHKSQGATLDVAAMDLGKDVFEAGQAYVALSRLRASSGLFLQDFEPTSICCNLQFLSFNTWMSSPQQSHFRSRAALDASTDELRTSSGCVQLRPHPLANTYELVSAEVADCSDDRDDNRDELLVVSMKSKGRKNVYNVIVFDFETYHSERAGSHIVYGVQAKLVRFETNAKDKTSRILAYQGVTQLPLSFDMTLGIDCSLDESVSDLFFDWIMGHVSDLEQSWVGASARSSKKPIYLCAYNGNRFDLFWFARYLMAHEQHAKNYRTSVLTRGSSSLIQLKLYSATTASSALLATHDLCDILHMSLAKAVLSFGGESALGKDCWPHLYLNDDNICEVAEKKVVAIQLTDFPKSSRKTVQKLVASGEMNLDAFDLFGTYHAYLVKDVQALIDVYKGFDTICVDKTRGAHVWEFSTMAQMTWYCFVLSLDARFTRPSAGLSISRKDRGTVLSRIFRLSREDDKFVGQSIYGGCVLPRVTSFTSAQPVGTDYKDIHDYLVDADICSMYVGVMMKEMYPFGEPRYASAEMLTEFGQLIASGKCEELPMGCYEVEFRFRPYELHPSVPHRDASGKLIWANCAYDEDTGDYSTGKFIRSVITGVDLRTIMKISAGEVKPVVHKAFVWPYQGTLFKDWVTQTFEMKQLGARILADPNSPPEARAKASALKAFGKLMGNACYGASAMRDHKEVFEFVHSQKEMMGFVRSHQWTHTINGERYANGLDNILVVKGIPIASDFNSMCGRPRYLGAHTLSYTRAMLAKIINVVNPFSRNPSKQVRSIQNQPYYGDTDSVFVPAEGAKRLVKNGMFGTEPGKLTDDQYEDWNSARQANGMPTFAKIIRADFPAPKTYGVRAILPNNTIHDGIRAKGIPSHQTNDIVITVGDKTFEKLDYDTMTAMKEHCAVSGATPITVLATNRLTRMGLNLSSKDREANKVIHFFFFIVQVKYILPNYYLTNFFCSLCLYRSCTRFLPGSSSARCSRRSGRGALLLVSMVALWKFSVLVS